MPDPYRYGWSPYIGVANNPVNSVDPDGGCPDGNCPDVVVQGDCKCSYVDADGYRDAKGVYYITEGHHRMVAAFEVYKSTGNASAINALLQNGTWRTVTSAPAAARPLPSLS